MPLFNWTEENSVGVEEIDNQHKKIFSIINNFYDLMSQSKAQEEINNILNQLNEYAKFHFETEEKYFEQFNYENKEEHTKLHQRYNEKINKFVESANNDGATIASFGILDFLEDWWLNHINIEDKGYTECFNSHGLK